MIIRATVELEDYEDLELFEDSLIANGFNLKILKILVGPEREPEDE